MKRATVLRGFVWGALAIALAGCDLLRFEPPGCHASVPAQADLLRLPELSTLTFHKRASFEPSRGSGFDLWADAKFEYKAAVEFAHAPSPKAPEGSRFCVESLSIKLAMPLDDARRAMLQSFVRAIATRTGRDPGALAARMEALVREQAKYRPLEKDAVAAVEAGRISHPHRGEMFVVAFIWQ